MSRFIYPVNLLSEARELHFTPLSHDDFKNLIKLVINGDTTSFSLFLNELFTELCIEKTDFNTVSALDKAYILIFLYGTNVSTEIKFTLKCPKTDKPFDYTLDLAKVLELLDHAEIKHTFTTKCQGITYECTLPRSFEVSKNYIEVFPRCLKSITSTFGKKFNLLADIKDHLVNKTPIKVINQVREWLIAQNNELQKVNFIGVQSPHTTEPAIIKFVPNLFDNSLLEFVKCLFKDNLNEVYRQEFTFIKQYGFQFADFSRITPIEMTIFDGIEREKIKKPPELISKVPV